MPPTHFKISGDLLCIVPPPPLLPQHLFRMVGSPTYTPSFQRPCEGHMFCAEDRVNAMLQQCQYRHCYTNNGWAGTSTTLAPYKVLYIVHECMHCTVTNIGACNDIKREVHFSREHRVQ